MDSSYLPVKAKGGLLFALKVPSDGGETEFADMRAAYDALDTEMREKLDKSTAYHSINCTYARYCTLSPLIKVGPYGTFQAPPLRNIRPP